MSSDDPISTYKQASAGSISGFNSVTLADDTTLAESNASAEVIIEKLAALIMANLPSHIRELLQEVEDHENDFNNPHHDTFANISGGDTSGLFKNVIPGTAPLAAPVSSMRASLDMDIPFTSVQCVRPSEMIIVDEQGFLESLSDNAIKADWSTGRPIYPCWPEVNQLIAVADISSSTDFMLTNCSATYDYHTGIVPEIFSTQTTLTETGATGHHGFSYSKTGILTVGKDYSFNIFFYPSGYAYGTLYLDFNDKHLFVSLLDGETFLVSDGALGVVNVLPNGWRRISLSITTQSADATVALGFDPNNYTDLASAEASTTNGASSYAGTAGQTIVSVVLPQLVDVCGLPPPIQSGQLAASTLTYPGFIRALPLNELMFLSDVVAYKSLTDTTSQPVITVNNVYTMAVTNNAVTHTLQGHTTPTVFTGTLNHGGATQSGVSYSPEKVSFRSSFDARQDITDFTNNAPVDLPKITSVTFGPFRGGISAYDQYAVSDTASVLDFMIGG